MDERPGGSSKKEEVKKHEGGGETLKQGLDVVEKPKDLGGKLRNIGSRMFGLGKKVVGFAGIAAESVGEMGRDVARSFLTKQFNASEKNHQKWEGLYEKSKNRADALTGRAVDLKAKKDLLTEQDLRELGSIDRSRDWVSGVSGEQVIKADEAKEKSEKLGGKLDRINAQNRASYQRQAKYQKWLSGK